MEVGCPCSLVRNDIVTLRHLFLLSSVTAISEVEFKDGVAHATSFYDHNWTADKAFILGHATGWRHNPTAFVIFPILIWYEFPADKTFVPAGISFRPRNDNAPNEGPTMWKYVGSNDAKCSKAGNWTVLCEDLSDAGYRTKFTTKYCDVDDKSTRKFRCLGIMVLNTHHDGGVTALKDVRMWKKLYV